MTNAGQKILFLGRPACAQILLILSLSCSSLVSFPRSFYNYGVQKPAASHATNPPQSTANDLLFSKHSPRLIPPSLLNFQSPSQVQAAVSSLVSSLAFLDEYQSASNRGKARLLDGSAQHGPSVWHVRMPKAEGFRYFEQGTDPISSARAADLLACPPHLVDKNCLSWHPSNHVSTVYPSEPMRVTSCTAVKGSVFMVPSVTRSVMSSASSSNVVGFARLLSVRCRIDR